MSQTETSPMGHNVKNQKNFRYLLEKNQQLRYNHNDKKSVRKIRKRGKRKV